MLALLCIRNEIIVVQRLDKQTQQQFPFSYLLQSTREVNRLVNVD